MLLLDENVLEYMNKTHLYLRDMYFKAVSDAIRFNFMVNAGGAVAVLSFMGTSETIRMMKFARLSLASFGVGLILTGLFYFRRFVYVTEIMRAWEVNISKYGQEGYSLDEILGRLDIKVSNIILLIVLGCLGFGAFVVGVIFGGTAMFS